MHGAMVSAAQERELGQMEMCLILLLPLLEQCLVFDMFMLCFFCSTSGQDNSIVMMHVQQVGTHSILQSC